MQQEMDDEQKEITLDFIAEGREILESLDPNLMKLECSIEAKEAPNQDVIHDIFRSFHSLKGAAGFLKLTNISNLTHHAESLLDLFRKGKAEIKTTHLELFYQSGDLLKEILDMVQATYSDKGKEAEVAEFIKSFKDSYPDQPSEEPPSLVSEIGLGLEDIRAILPETLVLLDQVIEVFNQLEEDGRNLTSLDEVVRDMGIVMGHMSIVGHADLSIVSRKIGQLARHVKEHQSQTNKHLMGLLVRMLEALKAAITALNQGRDSDHGPVLLTLMDELLHLEAGGSLSSETTLLLGETLVQLGVITRDHLKVALQEQQRPLGEILVDMNAISEAQLAVGLKLQDQQKQSKGQSDRTQSIRVDLIKLDLLGNLVGELVIAENMVTHHESVTGEGFESFSKSAQVLNRISREIQDLVMSLRMVPIQGTFQKLTRVVRDATHKLSKKAVVEVFGEETEIDKNVVDNLSSPLIHIVRNALDHGLELPAERLDCGKKESGSIKLTASQEGGEIVIEISDDGRGLNRETIIKKAREKELLSENDVALDDSEIFNLIMLPGFSTVTQVTELSGRGVGMDVVKQNIDSLHGSISINSEKGVGSTFSLRIPLTLSIIEGMLVCVGETVLTIPLLRIRESLVVKEHCIVRSINGGHSIKLRNRLIPIVFLYEYFGLPSKCLLLEEGILVVVEYGQLACCLLVDRILGQRQTVIKRISNFFDEVPGISGFSILSNGDITMILDVANLVSRVHKQDAQSNT